MLKLKKLTFTYSLKYFMIFLNNKKIRIFPGTKLSFMFILNFRLKKYISFFKNLIKKKSRKEFRFFSIYNSHKLVTTLSIFSSDCGFKKFRVLRNNIKGGSRRYAFLKFIMYQNLRYFFLKTLKFPKYKLTLPKLLKINALPYSTIKLFAAEKIRENRRFQAELKKQLNAARMLRWKKHLEQLRQERMEELGISEIEVLSNAADIGETANYYFKHGKIRQLFRRHTTVERSFSNISKKIWNKIFFSSDVFNLSFVIFNDLSFEPIPFEIPFDFGIYTKKPWLCLNLKSKFNLAIYKEFLKPKQYKKEDSGDIVNASISSCNNLFLRTVSQFYEQFKKKNDIQLLNESINLTKFYLLRNKEENFFLFNKKSVKVVLYKYKDFVLKNSFNGWIWPKSRKRQRNINGQQYSITKTNLFTNIYKYRKIHLSIFRKNRIIFRNYIKYMKFIMISDMRKSKTKYSLKKFKFIKNFDFMTHVFNSKYILKRFLAFKYRWLWRRNLKYVFSIKFKLIQNLNLNFNLNLSFFKMFFKRKKSAICAIEQFKLKSVRKSINNFWNVSFKKILNHNFELQLIKENILFPHLWNSYSFKKSIFMLRTPFRFANLNSITMKHLLIMVKYGSSSIIVSWLRNLITYQPIRSHTKILHYVTSALDLICLRNSIESFIGVHVNIRGKIGMTGSVRKRKYVYTWGQVSRTNILYRSSFTSSIILTKSGVLGLSVGVFYE